MFFNITKLLTLFIFLVYYYAQTKNKILLWIIWYISFFVSSVAIFRNRYPDVPFFSATPQYLALLVIVGIPTLVLIAFVFMESDRQRNNKDYSIGTMFEYSTKNILLWLIIVVLNVLGYLIDKLI